MLCEKRSEPVEHIVDRAVVVVVSLVDAGLGNPSFGKLGRNRVDRGVNIRGAHQADSLIVIAPDLLRLASMPCPKVRETSSSTIALIDAHADAWIFAASL